MHLVGLFGVLDESKTSYCWVYHKTINIIGVTRLLSLNHVYKFLYNSRIKIWPSDPQLLISYYKQNQEQE
jgi:hypothetical protein